jgi:hypothetical protein
MAFTYRLVRERSRVGIDPGGQAWLQVVYALNDHPPSGARQVLVPTLQKALEARGLRLIALDLFDEFVRLHLPLEASARDVEQALEEALRGLQPAPPLEIPREVEEQLGRYLSGSSR